MMRDGLGAFYAGLENVAGMFVRVDGREWLAVLPAAEFLKLLRRSEELLP